MPSQNTIEQFKKELSAFRMEVSAARAQYDQYLQNGVIPAEFQQRLHSLTDQEQNLLTAALPFVRSRLLPVRDPEATLEALIPKGASIDEETLSPETKALCHQLISKEPPQELDIPSPADDRSSSGIMHSDAGTVSLGISEDPGAPYMSIRNGHTCFLFLDDGAVVLLENNDGWECRRKPLVHECFAENAIMESDHSCLILNLDHGIDRLSYQRLETAEDLYDLSLYAP